ELAVALDSARRFTEKLQTNDTALSKQREIEDLSNSPSPKEKQRRQSIHSTNGATNRLSNSWNEPPIQHMKTPDLTSDASDDTESLVASPETPRAEASADDLDALCDSCSKPLFSINGGGKIVTVPAESGYPGRYHSACFVCSICQEPFSEKHGAAAFVRQCAPALKPKIVTRQRPVSMLPILRPEEEPAP
ncbi:11964_t:CDS:2, partial [Acaulospora colombiana]